MSNTIKEMGQRSEMTKLAKLDEWTRNAFENYQEFHRKEKAMLEDYVGTCSGPCIVTSSGPSLDTWLAGDFPSLPVLAGPSQAMAVLAHNKQLVHITMYDTHPLNFDYLRPDKIDWKCSLITHPSCDPQTLRAWNSYVIWYHLGINYHDSHVEDSGLTMGQFLKKYKPNMDFPVSWYMRDEYILFLKNTLLRAYPEIRLRVMSTSCTPPHAMIIADIMGYDPIYLIGADNCYSDDKARADGYRLNTINNRIERSAVYGYKPDGAEIVLYNGRKTTKQFLSYRNEIIYQSMGIKAQIYEVTDNPGILNFFPVIHYNDIGKEHIQVNREDRIKKAQDELRR